VSEEPGQGAPKELSAEEEEAYRRIEAEIGRMRVEDVLVQSVVSLLNLSARRIGKEDERDLEQARLGIDAVRALVDLLPADAAGQVRDALSQVQMLYAREASGSPPKAAKPAEGADQPSPAPPPSGGRTAEPPPRIWTPPGSTS
jgi:hypothetical protein